MYDPQQELFSKLLTEIKAKGYDVYDGFLPPDGTPYPFVYLGDCRQSDENTKTQIVGTVNQTIHVWHNNVRQRGTVSGMLNTIKSVCRGLRNTPHFSWSVGGVYQDIMPDNTTKTPLTHGVLEVEFRFS